MKRGTLVVTLAIVALVGLGASSIRGAQLALPCAAGVLTIVIVASRPRVLGWRLAALGSAFWTVEESAWAVQRLTGTGTPTIVTDIAYYGGTALWLAALLTMPGRRFPSWLTLPFLPALALIGWLYLQDAPRTIALQFPLVDVLLVMLAMPALESALRGKASEGRLLWALGFVVRALTAGAFSWLYAVPGLGHSFFLLWLLPYAFLALGVALELRDENAGIWAAGAAIVGLEAVTLSMLTLLYRSGDIERPYTMGIVVLLGYFQFAGIMLLLLSDRRRRIQAEQELKAWGGLIDRVTVARTGERSTLGTLKQLLAALSERLPEVTGLEVYADGTLVAGAAQGYAYPLVSAGTEIGRLYFSRQPGNTNVLDAVAPFLSGRIQQSLDQAQWQTRALTDPLTGLLNRRGLEARLPDVVAGARHAGRPVSVVVLDLDHFKRVNDFYDHATGDRALRELSAILTEHLRGGDLAVRWGGEEFVVVLHDADRDAAADVVRRIRTELRHRVVRPITWPLTFSAGLAGGEVPSGVDQIAAWTSDADSALKQAKRAGRDRVETAA